MVPTPPSIVRAYSLARNDNAEEFPFLRSESYEIIDHDVPRTHVLIARSEDADCSHLI